MSVEDHGIEAIRKAAEPMTSGDKSDYRIKTTSYDALGNEGTTINSVKAVTGKDGIDRATNTLQTIGYEHHEIHAGSYFYYCDYALNNADGDTIEFVMTTPNTAKWVHLLFEVYSTLGSQLELYEGASGIDGGTNIIPRNNNRNSDNTSVVTIVKDPTTITSDGVRAAGFLAGGSRSSGLVTRDKEIVLKQNTIYLVRITSDANSNDISWCAEWYEHTNKN